MGAVVVGEGTELLAEVGPAGEGGDGMVAEEGLEGAKEALDAAVGPGVVGFGAGVADALGCEQLAAVTHELAAAVGEDSAGRRGGAEDVGEALGDGAGGWERNGAERDQVAAAGVDDGEEPDGEAARPDQGEVEGPEGSARGGGKGFGWTRGLALQDLPDGLAGESDALGAVEESGELAGPDGGADVALEREELLFVLWARAVPSAAAA
jgi:hypothetical protein